MAGGDDVQQGSAELWTGATADALQQGRDGLRIDREAVGEVRSRAEPLEVLNRTPRRPHARAVQRRRRSVAPDKGPAGKRHTGAPFSAAEGVGDGRIGEEGGQWPPGRIPGIWRISLFHDKPRGSG
jgi:hypothetical protein